MSASPSGTVHSVQPHGPFWEQEWAALDNAARLAELWDVALRASFRLGFTTGHDRGVIAGRAVEAAAWQAIITGYSALIDVPTRAELDRVRRPTNTPCSGRCGACSRCIHAATVAWNLAHYGRPDYPGLAGRPQRRKEQP